MRAARCMLCALLVIGALLAYQFVYKDFAYRRDAIEQRNQLLTRGRAETSTYDAANDARNKCWSKHPGTIVARKKCAEQDAAWKRAIERSTAYRELEALHRAVIDRAGGPTPDWWIK